jgi:hypothetical protein
VLVGQFDALAHPGHPQMVDIPVVPCLWTAAVERWYWDPEKQQIWQVPR